MNKLLRGLLSATLVIAPTSIVLISSAHAQDDFFDQLDSEMPADEGAFDGFDDPAGETDDGFGAFGQGDDLVDEPADVAAPNVNNAAATENDAEAPLGEHANFVRAVQERNPQTADELFRAIDQLIRVGRSDVAADYLKQLSESKLNDIALARLEREFGRAALLRLAGTSELAPTGTEFARRVMEASRRIQIDPRRLEAWVESLGSADRSERAAAASNLLRAGAAAVDPIVRGLGRDNVAPNASQLGREVLLRLGDDAVPPLIGHLSNAETKYRVIAIQMLGRIGSQSALPYLVTPAFAPRGGASEREAATVAVQQISGHIPTQTDAEHFLALEARSAYQGQLDAIVDPVTDRVVSWTWNAVQGRVVRKELRTAEASALAATRMYRDLNRLHPAHHEYGVRYVVSRLDLEQMVLGLDQPLPTGRGSTIDLIERSGSDLAQRVLRVAIRDRHDAAAIGAAKVLGQLGDTQPFNRLGDLGSALGEALIHPNRRVRFAAAAAAVRAEMPTSFDGAGRAAEALAYFATADGQATVLVAHPRWSEAQRIASLFSSRGFQAIPVTLGRDLIRRARQSPDVELIVLSDRLNPMTTWDTIEELRVSPKTNQLPLAVLTRSDRMVTAERLAFAQGNLPILVEAIDDEALLAEMPRLFRPLDRRQVSSDQRLEQAENALNLLDSWLDRDDGRSVPLVVLSDHLEGLIRATDRVETVGAATRVIGKIGSPDAQAALVNLANDRTRTVPTREAAVDAFRASAAKFGLLLTRDQILRQYELYNASRDLDRETQSLLGSILDVIEEPHTPVIQAEAEVLQTAGEIR